MPKEGSALSNIADRSPQPSDDSVVSQFLKLVRSQANRQVIKRLGDASEQLSTLATSIREMGDDAKKRQTSEFVTNLTDSAAIRIENVGEYLKDAQLDSLTRDIGAYAEENPAIAALTAAAAGYALVRLVKVTVSSN